MTAIQDFQEWFTRHGGRFHPSVRYAPDSSGFSIVTAEPVASNATIVTCPFSLAITPSLSLRVLSDINITVTGWSERQLVCSYIVFHWIISPETLSVFMHAPYLNTLPDATKLRTPLHFTPEELETLKGTNMYGATMDRKRDWLAEWEKCRKDIATTNEHWAEAFTWDRYLTASTYLSSRAFPSTLLSASPSLVQTAASHPVLLPGVDALNHARAQPVSWVVNTPSLTGPSLREEPSISLQSHIFLPAGAEVFNNYGPKPNSELLLGYGFSLPENPDDTIVLKIGGGQDTGQKWEVGRAARGVEGLWDEIVASVRTQRDDEAKEDEYEQWSLILDAADLLESMSMSLLERLPVIPPRSMAPRPDVEETVSHYVRGQREVLCGLISFASKRQAEGIELARIEGVEVEVE
ncbi:SET domain-containing protein [Amylostereum chailletii]|nr:SET domain-containing protein [Amylostereum chailletii]